MNRKNFYLLIICLLLISNFVIFFFVIKKPKEGFNPDGPKNIIIEKLQFDDKQIVLYQKLIDQHRKDIKENDAKILSLKKELYSYLNTKGNEIKIDSLTSNIGKIQKNIEDIHFKHFLNIKELCKPMQLAYFEELSENLTEVFNQKKHQKPQPK